MADDPQKPPLGSTTIITLPPAAVGVPKEDYHLISVSQWNRLRRRIGKGQPKFDWWINAAFLFFGSALATLVPAIQDVQQSHISLWVLVCAISIVAGVICSAAYKSMLIYDEGDRADILRDMDDMEVRKEP